MKKKTSEKVLKTTPKKAEEKIVVPTAKIAAPLKAKQEMFCKEYLIDLNATQAAIRSGYSKKTAKSIGQENLTKPDIQKRIGELIKARSDRCEITADNVLKELALIAFSDPRKVMKWGPKGVELRESSDLTDEEARLVSEVSQTITDAGGSIKLKMNDKVAALTLVGKHLKIFTERLEFEGTIKRADLPDPANPTQAGKRYMEKIKNGKK